MSDWNRTRSRAAFEILQSNRRARGCAGVCARGALRRPRLILSTLPLFLCAIPPGNSQLATVETNATDAASSIHTTDPADATTVDDPADYEKRAYDLWFGRGVPPDRAEAIRNFEMAAASGRALAQHMLGMALWAGDGVEQDPHRAIELLRSAAMQGYARAQSFMGWAYDTGNAVERDHREAHKWYSAAAHQQDPYAIYQLASMYAQGRGVERNRDAVLALLTRAAELHSSESQRLLAYQLLQTTDPAHDPDKAVYLLGESARAGDGAAQLGLAWQYFSGRHVARDWSRALFWMSRASQSGQALASLWLAEFYAKGIGTPSNAVVAEWQLNQALAAATGGEKNSFSWTLSVSVEAPLRNGSLAVRVMTDLLADPANRSPARLDTLAAAYAEVGNFDGAVATQEEAISVLRSAYPDAPALQAYTSRLELYRLGRPYRE